VRQILDKTYHYSRNKTTHSKKKKIMSHFTLSDCSLWLRSLRFSVGRRHVTFTLHTSTHWNRLTTEFSQLSTTAPHHLSWCSTPEQPTTYHILSWRRQFWPAIRWHDMQHDVTAVLCV